MSENIIKEHIHSRLIKELEDVEKGFELSVLAETIILDMYPLIDKQQIPIMVKAVVEEINGYGFLTDYIFDRDISEIMINSTTRGFIEKCGELIEINFSTTKEDLHKIIQRAISFSATKFDIANPIVDAWLEDGSRLNAVMTPIAQDSPYLTIRKFRDVHFDIKDFCVDKNQENLIKELIKASKNIVFAGSTSSGKTSLMNACIGEIDDEQRIITIEETKELRPNHRHCIALVARQKNSEGIGEVSMSDLVKTSLRMRPDRLIIGEVRSSEAFDLIQALNTGHSGSFCTIHANGPEEVLNRIASLAMFAHDGFSFEPLLNQTALGIDYVVFIKRTSTEKRQISSVHKIENIKGNIEINEVK